MAQVVKIQNAEEALISKIIENVRSGNYVDTLRHVDPKADSEWTDKVMVNGNIWVCKYQTEKVSRYVLTVKDKEFSGKFVRRLVKACELAITGRKAVGGKKKEIMTQDELEGCWDLI